MSGSRIFQGRWDVCIFALHWDTIHYYTPMLFFRYTIVLIYYAFCLVFMMLLRPLLVKKIACGLGKTDRFKSIYAALYFFPILTVLQAVGGGLLCECRLFIFFNEYLRMYLVDICVFIFPFLILSDYAFPYIILVLSLVTLAVYMSASEIQVNILLLYVFCNVTVLFISYWKTNVLKLFVSYLPQSFKNLVAKKKRLVVLFSHWLLHAYGIISISRLDKLGQDLPLLALVPGPALFYLLTARFTEPNRILSEGGNGHWCHFLL